MAPAMTIAGARASTQADRCLIDIPPGIWLTHSLGLSLPGRIHRRHWVALHENHNGSRGGVTTGPVAVKTHLHRLGRAQWSPELRLGPQVTPVHSTAVWCVQHNRAARPSAAPASAPEGATIAALHDALTAGTLSSADLTACYLDRIERFDPRLHAVITANPLAAGGAQASDSAVILGKANPSEWANFRSTSSTSGWSTLGGQAVNPWGEGRNPSLELRLGGGGGGRGRPRPGRDRDRDRRVDRRQLPAPV